MSPCVQAITRCTPAVPLGAPVGGRTMSQSVSPSLPANLLRSQRPSTQRSSLNLPSTMAMKVPAVLPRMAALAAAPASCGPIAGYVKPSSG